jgi:phosphoribosyl-ATP pyrophosphohydrolase
MLLKKLRIRRRVGSRWNIKTFEDLWKELNDKVSKGEAESNTVALISRGVHAIGKKVVEEAAESWMAAEYESVDRTAEEISQLLYHVQVLMISSGVDIKDVYRNL